MFFSVFSYTSFHIVDVIKTIKKRKLQAEQLGLPTAKHKCWECFPCNESVSMSVENADVHSIHTSLMKVKTREQIVEDRPEVESWKDSNSFFVDFDSATSVYGEAKIEPEFSKSYLYNRPSTSINFGTESVKNAKYSLDSLTVVKDHSGIEEVAFFQHDGGVQVLQNHEDYHLEFGNDADYINPEYGDIEQCTDKELEDILYSNELNPNKYVLSSGRWSVNQEVQSSVRQPTIDQEFEQYFSTLML
ncbi:hypothetical protein FNV43_RR09899 [Rhamnella rubrinervis]|uniref:Uncharacterized protein n=1 Tax=Rhamnella rubrinervis TaxID=2594499 RepID=A0A8K0HB98_9ROSA|nr:hypothetical protein FNV43_RR09899 [Rhamnella rubrinervis]